jgi:hypothetical protein
MLGFPRGVLAPLIGVAIRWFTFVNHGKCLDVISGNLYKELWNVRTTLLFNENIVFYCYMSLLHRFAIGKFHTPNVMCSEGVLTPRCDRSGNGDCRAKEDDRSGDTNGTAPRFHAAGTN